MFGLNELKPCVSVTDDKVDCPVKDCDCRVDRQRNVFRCEDRFKCQKHKIFISPSTFEYMQVRDNILWTSQADLDCLELAIKAKRECRMRRDNSEDAVTWNIFRFMETHNQLLGFVKTFDGGSSSVTDLVYWSLNLRTKDCWPELSRARREFGEKPNRGSEPDFIVVTDKSLLFFEAKLGASNRTTPSDPETSRHLYESGGGRWYSHAFQQSFDIVACKERHYELMRLWLLGTWIANHLDLNFHLVNLVPSGRETNIETEFKPLIQETPRKTFRRMAWEDIYRFVQLDDKVQGCEKLLGYFRNKTLGYKGGTLQRAFSV